MLFTLSKFLQGFFRGFWHLDFFFQCSGGINLFFNLFFLQFLGGLSNRLGYSHRSWSWCWNGSFVLYGTSNRFRIHRGSVDKVGFELCINSQQRFLNGVSDLCLFRLSAPHTNKSDDHDEPNNQDNNPDNFSFKGGGTLSEFQLDNETQISVMIFGNDSDILRFNNWWGILDHNLEFSVEFQL